MTAYANLRNVLATMYRVNYFADHSDISNDLIDAFTNALTDLEDSILNSCKTSKDFDNAYTRFDAKVEKAARVASNGDDDFICKVIADVHTW